MLGIKPEIEFDESDKQKAELNLLSRLYAAKQSAKDQGIISADDLEKELGV